MGNRDRKCARDYEYWTLVRESQNVTAELAATALFALCFYYTHTGTNTHTHTERENGDWGIEIENVRATMNTGH